MYTSDIYGGKTNVLQTLRQCFGERRRLLPALRERRTGRTGANAAARRPTDSRPAARSANGNQRPAARRDGARAAGRAANSPAKRGLRTEGAAAPLLLGEPGRRVYSGDQFPHAALCHIRFYLLRAVFVWGVVMLFLPLLPVPEKYIVCAGLVLIAVVGLIPGIRKFTSLNREIRSIENDPPKILYEIHDGSYDLTAYNHGEKTGTSKTFLNEIYKKRELGQTKIFALYLNYDEQVNYIDARALPPEGLALLRRLLKMP